MKILFLTTQDLFGKSEAPEKAPGYTLNHYLKNGDEIVLVSNCSNNKKYRQLKVQVSTVFKLPFLNFPIGRIVNNAILFPIFCFFRILFSKKFRNSDIVYGYEVHGVLAGALLRVFYRARYVNRFQGTVLYPILKAPNFLGRILGSFKKIDHLVALKTPADLVLMTDDGTQGNTVLEKLHSNKDSKIVFWRNGTINFLPTESRSEMRKKLGLAESAFVYMTLSRLVPWKRVNRAIEAFAELRKLNPQKNRSLVIVGDGESRKSLETLAHELAVSDQIKFMGEVPQVDVPNVFVAADVFLSFYDLSNVGNPTLEALRFGKPIITLNAGDTSTVIDASNGILLQTFDALAAAEAMDRLEKDLCYFEKLRQGALESSRKILWSWEERLKAERNELLMLIRA